MGRDLEYNRASKLKLMKNPKVTVLMSVYNGEKYLKEAIDSILDQTFTNFEFLIINDGSTDSTSEILKEYKDPRIKIIDNKKNIGLTKSLNKGLKLAKGKYIARMDADDFSKPNRLEEQLEFMEKNQKYAVVGSFVEIIDKDGNFIQKVKRPIKPKAIEERLLKGSCIFHGSAIMRNDLIKSIGSYNEEMEKSQDYDLWLRLSEIYPLYNLPLYLYKFRTHENSITSKFLKEQNFFASKAKKESIHRFSEKILKDLKRGNDITKEIKEEIIAKIILLFRLYKYKDIIKKIDKYLNSLFKRNLLLVFMSNIYYRRKIDSILERYLNEEIPEQRIKRVIDNIFLEIINEKKK